MVQNRNKLIELFIGNAVTSIVHDILEKAIEDEFIKKRYGKELKTSFEVAINYRNKINPKDASLPNNDIDYIKNKIVKDARAELNLRISRGYTNIDFDLVSEKVENFLKNSKIKEKS